MILAVRISKSTMRTVKSALTQTKFWAGLTDAQPVGLINVGLIHLMLAEAKLQSIEVNPSRR